MIYPITMYACKCDNCGKGFEWFPWDEDGSGILQIEDHDGLVKSAVDDSNWHTEGDKHYCPDCFQGWDDEDRIVLRKIY